MLECVERRAGPIAHHPHAVQDPTAFAHAAAWARMSTPSSRDRRERMSSKARKPDLAYAGRATASVVTVVATATVRYSGQVEV
jgi:hypothetical protein